MIYRNVSFLLLEFFEYEKKLIRNSNVKKHTKILIYRMPPNKRKIVLNEFHEDKKSFNKISQWMGV